MTFTELKKALTILGLPSRATLLSCVYLVVLFCTLPAQQSVANDPFLLNNYALELLKKGENEKALEQLQQAFSLFPYNETLRKNLAEVYTLIGQKQMNLGQYDEAASSFYNARELFPETGRYGVLRGIALYSSKNYDAAIIEFDRVRSLEGDSVEILYYLGRAYYDNGNLSSALNAWDKALEINPGHKGLRELSDKARREFAVESRMDRGYSGKFNISYDSEVKSDLADEIMKTLESAYNRVGSDLSHFPAARVPVILYTKKDYRTITNGPDWSGGLYDGKIRLPIGGASQLTPSLKGVLYHEFTHVIVQEISNGNCPTWLNEGLAVYEEQKETGAQIKLTGNLALLPNSTLENRFIGLDTVTAAQAYKQSYLLVNYMISTFGWSKIKEILVNLGKGLSPEAAVARALEDYGLDYKSVMQEWREQMKKELDKASD